MAKRFSCWVIVAGAQPTAFRARRAEDLLPTLRQLQRTQSDVRLRWFDRGRFWESPEAADEAARRRRQTQTSRGPGWRPGGEHADPRAKYKLTRDQKRARFKRRLVADRTGGDEGRPARPRGPRPPRGPKRSR
jgi:hypothetical protein